MEDSREDASKSRSLLNDGIEKIRISEINIEPTDFEREEMQ